MSQSTVRERVTMSSQTIHNPDEPRHFMRVKPVPGRVRVLFAGRVLAESDRALRLIEAGRDLYDPVFYLPRSDVVVDLARRDKRTYCPLKGHASYFDLVGENGGLEAAEIAWSYEDTLEFAAAIKDRVAFDAARVVLEEHPAAG